VQDEGRLFAHALGGHRCLQTEKGLNEALGSRSASVVGE
jgi:hypothetical protein